MSYKITGAFTYHTIENVYQSPFLDLKVDLTDPVKINVELIIKTGDIVHEVIEIKDVQNFIAYQNTGNLYEDFNVSLHQTLYQVLQNDNSINVTSNFEIV
jgi:hypothetical protein